MQRQELGDELKKQLLSHQSEVNLRAVWGNISGDLDAVNKKKRKRRFAFWLFFGLIGLGCTGSLLGLLYWNNGKNADVVSFKKTDINYLNLRSEALHFHITGQGGDQNLSENSFSMDNDNTGLGNNSNGNKEGNINNIEELTSSENKKQAVGFNQKAKDLDGNNKETFFNENNNLLDTLAGGQSNTQNSALSSNSNSDWRETKDSMNVNALDPKQSIGLSDARIREFPSLLFFIPRKAAGFEYASKLKGQQTNSSDFKLSISLDGGIGYAFRKLEGRTIDSFSVKSQRENSEKSLETLFAGLQLKIKHRSDFYFKTGINYTRIAECFDNNSTSVLDTLIYGVEALVLGLDSSITERYGEVPMRRTTIAEQKVFNYYHFIDIPLLIGYEKRLNQRLSLNLEAGVLVNASLRTKGTVFNDNQNTLDIKQSQERIFKDRIGLSYQFGASLHYYLNEKVFLKLMPQLRYIPNSITTDDYVLDQKYLMIGIRTGVGIEF